MCGHAAKITLLQPGNRTCTYSVVSGYFWSSGYLGGDSVHGVCSDTLPRCSAGFGCKVFGGQVIALSSFFVFVNPFLSSLVGHIVLTGKDAASGGTPLGWRTTWFANG